MRKKPRVFLDTNIWFSAYYGSAYCATLVTAHLQGILCAVISQQVLEEITRNMQKKLPKALPDFERLIINNPPEVVVSPSTIPQSIQLLVDAKDQHIFASAMSADVLYFVTGNTKDFFVGKLEELTGIKIVKPKEAVEILDLERKI